MNTIDLQSLVKGKRVAVVGPAPHLMGSTLGSLIDSHDLVVRVNHGIPRGFENDVGKKCDVFFGNFNQDFQEVLQSDGFSNLQRLNRNLGTIIFPRLPWDIKPVRQQEFFAKGHDSSVPKTDWSFKFRTTGDIVKTANEYIALGGYPTTGSLVILQLVSAEPMEIFICGFSFYDQGSTYLASSSTGFSSVRPGHDMQSEVNLLRKIIRSTKVPVFSDDKFASIILNQNFEPLFDPMSRILRIRYRSMLRRLLKEKSNKNPGAYKYE